MTRIEFKYLAGLLGMFVNECGIEEQEKVKEVEDIVLQRIESMPTEKQINYIRAIEGRLSIRFKGETKQEARIFIRDHVEEFKARRPEWTCRPYERKEPPKIEDYEEEEKKEEDKYGVEFCGGCEEDGSDSENCAPGMLGWL